MSHQPVSPNNRSREQERRALLSYAFFRWESAVTLAMTLLLAILLPDPFRGTVPWWGWWMWIVLGVFAEALIVGTTLTDLDVRARIASQLFRDRLNLDALSDSDLRLQLGKALDTRDQMQVAIQRSRGRASGAPWDAVGDEVSNWIAAMYRLARRLDEAHDLVDLQRSRNVLPAQAQSLEQRLDKSAERASAQLNVSSSALEAIYIQMQLAAAKGADSRRLRQLREEIAGHAQSLSGLNDELAETIEQIAERSSP